MAIGARVGTAYVDIDGDFSPLQRSLDKLSADFNTKFKGIGDNVNRGITPGLQSVSKQSTTTSRDVDRMGSSFQGLGRNISGLNSQFTLFRNVANAARPAALITGLGLAAQSASALAGGAVAVTAALAPLAGLAGAAAAGLTAAAQGMGTFKLATAGVADALKEQLTQQSAVATGAGSSATAQRAAAQAIASAQEGVRTAHLGVRDATDRVAEAERGAIAAADALTRAKHDAKTAEDDLGRARDEARQHIIDLGIALEDAKQAEIDATESLKTARNELAAAEAGPSADEIAAAHGRVQSSLNGEERATYALDDARKILAAAEAGPTADDIAAAHDRLGDALRGEQHAALDLLDAQDKLKTLEDSGVGTARELEKARLAVADAEDRVKDTAEQSKTAREAVTKAEAGPDQDQIKRARLGVKDAEQAVKDAVDATKKARDELANAEAGGDPEKIAEARRKVEKAERDVEKAKRDGITASKEYNDAEKAGVDGADGVVAARGKVKDANDAVTKAADDLKAANQGVIRANQDLNEANHRVDLALQAVKNAQLNAADSATKAALSSGKLNAAFDKLPPAAQAFVRELIAMKPKLDDLRATAAAGLFPGVIEGLQAAARNFEPVKRVVAETAAVLGDLARKAGDLVGSPAWGRDIQTIGASNARIIGSVGTAGLSLADAFRHIVVAAGPLTEWLARLAESWSKQFAASAQAGRESGTLARFFEQTRAVVERLVSIGGSLATAFYNIGKAAAPLGREVLAAIDGAAQRFEDWTKSASGQNVLAQYFKDIKAPLFEAGRLIHDITLAFFSLGTQPGLADLILKIRTNLLPILTQVTTATTAAFGPVLVDALVQIVRLFGEIAGNGGGLAAYVRLLGQVAGWFADLLANNPLLGTFVAHLLVFKTVLSVLPIASFVSGLGSLVIGLTGATVAQEGLNLAVLSNPYVLAAAAVVALGVAFVLAYKNIESFRNAVDSSFAGVKAAVLELSTTVSGAASDVWDRYGKFVTAFATNFLRTITAVVEGVLRVLGGLADFVAGVLTGDWDRAWQGIKDIVGGTLTVIGALITGALNNLVNVFRAWLTVASGVFATAWDAIKAGAVAAWGAIVSAVTAYLNLLLTAFRTYVGLWQTVITTVWNAIKDATTATWNAIVSAVTAYLNLLLTGIRTYFGLWQTYITTVWNAIVTVTTATWNAIKDAVLIPLRAARDLADIVITGIVNRITAAWDAIKKATNDAWNAVRDFVLDALRAARDLGEAVLQGIFNRVQDMWSDVKTATSNAWAAIRDAVLDAVRFARDHIEDILQGIFNRVQGAFENIVTAAKRFGTAVGEAILNAMSGAGRAVQGVINKIIDVVNKVLSFVGADGIGHVAIFARGGTIDTRSADAVQYLARGGKITRPMAIVGEEAPRHPEYIIPTNPAYRPRAMELFGKLGSELNVPGYYQGGIIGRGAMDRMLAAGVPGFASGSPNPTGGQAWGRHLSKGQIKDVWIQAGGDPAKANLMAAIALAESGGWTARPNEQGSGAFGLWQILGQEVGGSLADPLVNAKNAIWKLKYQGLTAWEAYTNNTYAKYLGAGPGNAVGDIVGAVGDALSGAVDLVGNFIGGLPGIGDLPDWIKPVGSFVIDKVKDFIKDKVGSIGGGAIGGASNIVDLGHKLQAQGYQVSENPAFGGVAPVHAPGSYHYSGRAIDVNADGKPQPEYIYLDRLYKQLQSTPGVVELLWRVAGHFDHLHVAMARGGTLDKMGFTGGTPVLPFVGAYKTGGIVPQDGMAYVHKDETIIPANGQAAVPVHLVVDVNDGEFARAIHVRQVAAGRKATAQFHAGRLRP